MATVDSAGVVTARASGETTVRVAYARMLDTHYQATLFVVDAAYVALRLAACSVDARADSAADALQSSGGAIYLSVGGVYCVDAFAYDAAAHRLDTARAALSFDIALDAARFETLRGCVSSRPLAHCAGQRLTCVRRPAAAAPTAPSDWSCARASSAP